MSLFGRKPSEGRPTTLFFAADVHGSDVTFRKFVNAARFYSADALVFGGDLMGKALVPIIEQEGGTYRADHAGNPQTLQDGEALKAFQKQVENVGFYWVIVEPEEYRALAEDRPALDRLFEKLARDRLASWVAFAQERLSGSGVRCYLTGGNDDAPAVLSVLDEATEEPIVPCEHRVVELDDEHTMITVGYSTPTPWDTPREATEEEIAAAIDASLANVPDPSRCVFNIHVPPIDSGLDRCIKLEASGDGPIPVTVAGHPLYFGAGSRSVLEAIREHQPVVGLHGHIHESPGRARYGRTQCFNPGSEYGQGILRGLLVSIQSGRLVGYQRTAG